MDVLQTPYFLIKTAEIDKLIDEAFSVLHSKWPQGIIGYSFKTNNLPWIITHMKKKKIWAEVVSSDEYLLAKALGFEIEHIIFNGPVKGKKEFIEAVENGAKVNIDSKRELSWLLECDSEKIKNASVGLRVNFCIEDYCEGESQCGKEDGRFGFSYECGELYEAISFLKKNDIVLSGFHMHCSSKTRSVNVYKAIAEMVVNIVREYSLELEYVDIGGGFFGGVPGKPSFESYFSEVYEIFKKEPLLSKTNLIIEPGISLIGSGIDYITTVVDEKVTKNNRFVLLDGSRIHIDPFKRKTRYDYSFKRRQETFEKQSQILCGFTCMEDDRFFEIDDTKLSVGDQVVFERVGAYTMGLIPQFIEFYPAVYAEVDNKKMLVRKKNTHEDFLVTNFDE